MGIPSVSSVELKIKPVSSVISSLRAKRKLWKTKDCPEVRLSGVDTIDFPTKFCRAGRASTREGAGVGTNVVGEVDGERDGALEGATLGFSLGFGVDGARLGAAEGCRVDIYCTSI